MYESLPSDQQQRWRDGDRVRVADYLRRFPELPEHAEVLQRLCCNEIILRRTYGETPSAAEYVKQFPAFSAAIEVALSDTSLPLETLVGPSKLPSFGTLPDQKTSMSSGTVYPTEVTKPIDQGASQSAAENRYDTVAPNPTEDTLASYRRFQGYPEIPGFEVIDELGRGGMGVVYRARQTAANRIVALKVVRNELLQSMPMDTRSATLERFRTEAQAAAQLQHDNLVSVYEIGEVPTSSIDQLPLRYYAMRYVQGRSLIDILRDGPLENKRAARYLEPVARALHMAHREGILHRDIKPHNILIEQATDRPLLTDFGLAKFVEGHDGLTHAGEVMGTPAYMSPEQAKDAARVTSLADLYSLGATLYHLLTGRPPFHAATFAETMRQIMDVEPVAPRQLNNAIDRDLETICLKCLQKEASRRYADCNSLAEDLHRYLSGHPIIARPVGSVERSWRWCKRNPISAGLSGLAILLALATVLSIVIGYRQTTEALAISESRLERALVVVDELFTRVSEEELLNEPGMQPLRKDLLEKALKHYTYFLTESGGKDNIRDEVANAHFRVGVISQAVGDIQAAEIELMAAIEIQQSLVERESSDWKHAKSLADSLNSLGGVLNSLRRYDESITMFERASAIREQLAATQPENPELSRLAANSRMNLGLAEMERGQYAQGTTAMLAAQQARQTLLNAHPDAVNVRRDLAMGWYLLGKTETTQKQPAAAREYLQKAVDEFRKLLVFNPRSMNNRYYLGVALRFLGGVLAESNQIPEAIDAFRAANEAINSLAANNPDVVAYQSELAVLSMNLGTIYSDSDDLTSALIAWQQARAATELVLARDPKNPDLMGDMAAILGALGDLNRRSGNFSDAHLQLSQANTFLRELLEQDASNPWFTSQLDENAQALKEIAPQLPKEN